MDVIEAQVGIVGAGPLGLELAVALTRAGISYVQWEAGQVGATMQWWPAGTRWFSSNDRIAIAGVPLVTAQQEKATREEYLAYLRGVVMQFGLKVNTYERVERVEREGDGFVVRTRRRGGERVYKVGKVVLCTGGTERAKVLGVPGEDLPHVSHYFQDPHAYFGQRLLVVGGRNSAVEAALRCYRAGAEVAISYRRAGLDAKDIKYWLYPEIEGLVKAGKIAGHFGTTVEAIGAESVRLRETATGEVREVGADFVLLMTGYVADMGLFRQIGIALRDVGERSETPVFDEETMETNVPGVYVAGTAIAGTQTKYRVFLENCHVHVERIVAALQGRRAAGEAKVWGRPES